MIALRFSQSPGPKPARAVLLAALMLAGGLVLSWSLARARDPSRLGERMAPRGWGVSLRVPKTFSKAAKPRQSELVRIVSGILDTEEYRFFVKPHGRYGDVQLLALSVDLGPEDSTYSARRIARLLWTALAGPEARGPGSATLRAGPDPREADVDGMEGAVLVDRERTLILGVCRPVTDRAVVIVLFAPGAPLESTLRTAFQATWDSIRRSG